MAAAEFAGDGADRLLPELQLLKLVNDVVVVTVAGGVFKKDCTDLVRRIALLTHLFEEMRDFKGEFRPLDDDDDDAQEKASASASSSSSSSSSSRSSWVSDLMVALQAAKCLLLLVAKFPKDNVATVSHFLFSIFSFSFSREPNSAFFGLK